MASTVRVRDLQPGEQFITVHTGRVGIRLSEEPPVGGAPGVEVTLSVGQAGYEEKTLHDDVKVMPWTGWVN